MEKLTNCPICGSGESSPLLKAEDHTVSRETFQIAQCKSCGFRFTNPRPKAEELGAYYLSEDYLSHSNRSKGIIAKLYMMVRRRTIKKKVSMINELNKANERSLLDIGCGTGEFLKAVSTVKWACTGVEPSVIARGIAQKQHRLNVIEEIGLDKLEGGQFDVITMWHVLEHVSLLNERIIQVKRLLKPGGSFVVAVPNCTSYDAKIYGEFWAAWDVPRHLYHFTPEDIGRLMSKHGLRIEKTLPMTYDAYYVSILSEKYKTGSISLFRSTWNGFKSNLAARKAPGTHSSQIYIIKAQEP